MERILYTAIFSFLLGAFLAGSGAWLYQDNKFTTKIERTANESAQKLAEAQTSLVKQERANNEAIETLNRRNAVQVAERDATIRSLRNRISASGGLYVAGSCKEAAGASATTTNSVTTEATTCRIDESVTERLIAEESKAMILNDYANVCYEYVQEIGKQRERMMKDNE